jgi:hypothetical protein
MAGAGRYTSKIPGRYIPVSQVFLCHALESGTIKILIMGNVFFIEEGNSNYTVRTWRVTATPNLHSDGEFRMKFRNWNFILSIPFALSTFNCYVQYSRRYRLGL